MATLFYAESRRPGLSRVDFLARWRAHGAYALEFASFRTSLSRYVHYDPVHDVQAFPDASIAYDALGEIACPDLATLRALLPNGDLRGPIRADGARTFARTRTLVRRIRVSPAADEEASWGTFLDLGFDDLRSAARAYADWPPGFDPGDPVATGQRMN